MMYWVEVTADTDGCEWHSVLRTTLDHDTHIACRAHSAAFVYPNSAPIRTELIQYDSGGFLRQSLNQFGFGQFHMGSDTFSNIPITKRIRDIVSLGSSLDIKSHIEIKDYGLSNTALPFPYSDHTVNFQTM